MARKALVPEQLRNGPFTLDEARRAGLTRYHLRSPMWRRIGPMTYKLARNPTNSLQLLATAARRLPPDAVFSGCSAAWLHGLDLAPCDPIDVTLPAESQVSARAGVRLHRARLDPTDVIERQGLLATSLTRTLADLATVLSLIETTVAADMALHAQLVSLEDLHNWSAAHQGLRGITRLRHAVQLAEPRTESPMETRLRLVLVLAGLPRPEAQVDLHDSRGRFLGRPDFLYRDRRLALEYDGGVHRDQLVEDNRRQNRLINAGYRLLRFTAPDILRNPDSVVSQVRGALS